MYFNFCFLFFTCYSSRKKIKKKKRRHDKEILLTKTKLNSKGVVISKALIDSNISHDEFVLINNEMM